MLFLLWSPLLNFFETPSVLSWTIQGNGPNTVLGRKLNGSNGKNFDQISVSILVLTLALVSSYLNMNAPTLNIIIRIKHQVQFPIPNRTRAVLRYFISLWLSTYPCFSMSWLLPSQLPLTPGRSWDWVVTLPSSGV